MDKKIDNINNENNQDISSVSNDNKQIDPSDAKIEFSKNMLTVEELTDVGYKKIPDNMTYGLEPLRQKMLNYITKSYTKKSTQKSINKALEGTFLCEIDMGTHLAHPKGQPNLSLGTELDDLTNQIRGQARFRENKTVPSIPKWPDIISGVFDVMSIVTSQFYLNEINTGISAVNQKLDKIEHRTEIKNISELETDYNTLVDTLSKINSLKKDKSRLGSYITNLLMIRERSETSSRTYKKSIEDTYKLLVNNNDKEDKIKENLKELFLLQNCYLFSLHNYFSANLMEILLMESPDLNEIIITSSNISKRVNESIDFINNAYQIEKNYINKSKCFDPFSKKKSLISRHIAGFEAGMKVASSGKTLYDDSIGTLGSDARDVLSDKFYDKLYKNRDILLNDCKNHYTITQNLLFANQKIADLIYDYVKRLDNKIRLVYIDGEWYYRNEIDALDHSREMMQIQTEKFIRNWRIHKKE